MNILVKLATEQSSKITEQSHFEPPSKIQPKLFKQRNLLLQGQLVMVEFITVCGRSVNAIPYSSTNHPNKSIC
jgi:hypothetical protein